MSENNDDPWLAVRDLDTGEVVPLADFEQLPNPVEGSTPSASSPATTFPVTTAPNASPPRPHTSKRELIKQTARRALAQTRAHSELSAESHPSLAVAARSGARAGESPHPDANTLSAPSVPSVAVRVTPHKKHHADFKNLRRYQKIAAHSGPVRVLALSPSGMYLASGGADGTVNVWNVAPPANDFRDDESADGSLGSQRPPDMQSESFLRNDAPHRKYHGHTGDIIALSWSKNDFLLSGSLDRHMRLWHPSRPKCLRSFPHNDAITSLTFHPLDEQICVSGTASGMLRMWHLKEEKLLSEAATDELITATRISTDGKTLLAGTSTGRCKFYTLFDEIQGEWQLVHTTQMDVRSSKGKNRKGAKVTGLVFNPFDPNEVLISSNDSRLRRYRMEDKSIFYKYTGHTCAETQLSGSFSPCGNYVLTGSENRQVYIWELEDTPPDYNADKNLPTDDHHIGGRDRNSRPETFVPHEHEYIAAAVFARTRYYPLRNARDPRPGNCDASGLVIVTASESGVLCVFACL